MPFVRALKIRFCMTVRSYSIRRGGKYLMKSRIIFSQPLGKSAATPPMRNQAGCMRAP